MKKLLLLVLIFAFFYPVGILQAAFSTSDYQFSKTINVTSEGFSYIPLDQQVLSIIRDDMADLRLTDANNQETPYQITPSLESSTAARPVLVINQSNLPGEYSFVLDLGKTGLLHNQITLDIGSDKDFLGDLYLEGSEDQKQWSAINNYKIFRVAPNYSNKSFTYPVSSWHFLRVRIAANPLPVLSLNTVKVSYLDQQGSYLSTISPTILSINPSTAGKTHIILDMGFKGYYVQNINLTATDRNFQRPVQAFTSNDAGADWKPLGPGGVVNHFVWSGYEAGEDTLTLNQPALRYIKLEVDDGSSPPLNVSQITAKGAFPRLLADLKPGTYMLWYGSKQAKKPQYDLERFSNLIDTQNIPVVNPSSQEVNPGYVAPVQPWTERNRWLLNVVLILAVVILGGLFIKNMRKV